MTTTATLAGLDKLADPTLLRTMSSALNSRGEVNAALYMGKSAGAIEALLARIAVLEEAATNSWFQLRHLQMFPENARNDATNELIAMLAALTLKENDCGN